MPRKFIYFINPVSGTRGKTGLQELIIQKTAEQNIPFEIAHTDPLGKYNKLKDKIADEQITATVHQR